MNVNVRAAILGGLAGTFCVAVAVTPMLRSDKGSEPTSVSGRRAASVAEAREPEATTTSLAPQPIPTTISPEPVVAERVSEVERRLRLLETGSTTTTVPPYVPEVVVPVTVTNRPTTTTSTPTTMPPAP